MRPRPRSFRLPDTITRMSDPDLFEISPDLEIRFEPVADGLPVLLIDNIFAHPEQISARGARVELRTLDHALPGPDGSIRGGQRVASGFPSLGARPRERALSSADFRESAALAR